MTKSKKDITKYLPKPDELLKAGAQFGHSTQRWHPGFKPFIYKRRANIYIINVEKTLKYMKKAFEYLIDRLIENPDIHILLVGTKKQAQDYVEKLGKQYGLFYINKKWPGGLLTNFEKVHESVEKLLRLKEQYIRQRYQLIKKELLDLKHEIEKLERKFGGLTFMNRVVDLVIVVDTKREEVALSEARHKGVPIIGVVDSNADPRVVDFPIPMNDDARRALDIFFNSLEKILADYRGDRLIKMRQNFDKYLKELEEKINKEFGISTQPTKEQDKVQKEQAKVVRVMAFTPLSELGLSAGLIERLEGAGISTVEELKRRTLEEIQMIRGIGKKAAWQIISKLKEYESRH